MIGVKTLKSAMEIRRDRPACRGDIKDRCRGQRVWRLQ
jgi:hypothetical protein